MKYVRMILRYGDRRLMLVAVLVLAGTLMLNFVVAGAAGQEAAQARAEQTRVQNELTSLQQQISLLGAGGGVVDINQLVAKIGTGEQAVPTAVDQIRTTARVAQLASTLGLLLSQFDPLPSSPVAGVQFGILKATPYQFKVSGSLSSVDRFMEAVWSDPSWVVTFESVSLFPEALPGSAPSSGGAASVFDSSVGATGVMVFWGLAVPPVLEAAVTGPATPGGGALPPSGAPQVPPGPSDVPAPDGVPPGPSDVPAPGSASPSAPLPLSSGVPAPS